MNKLIHQLQKTLAEKRQSSDKNDVFGNAQHLRLSFVSVIYVADVSYSWQVNIIDRTPFIIKMSISC